MTTAAHDSARWAAAGLDVLTGPTDGPGLPPPDGLVARLDSVTERILAASALVGDEVDLDGLGMLAVRAEMLGLSRRGRISCGGSCHLVRGADGWFAVSLSRPEDWELLPAWIGLPAGAAGNWAELHDRCRVLERDEAVERGALLGLPIAALPDGRRARPRSEPVSLTTTVASGGSRRRATPSGGSIRVADLSSMWAGPLCGSVLAAAGADVLKVESTMRPDGSRTGPAAFFELLNGAKTDVQLDLHTDDGVRGLEELLRSVDVVVESSRPRALRQLGIDAERLLADADGPRLWVSITGHGRAGAGADRVAFGDDAAVGGGLVVWDDGGPWFCADAIADPLTGLTAAAAALDALAAGGDGLLDVSMSAVAAHFAGPR